MSKAPVHPKRLIEVDLPIKKISAHARREKAVRHGHISSLHLWWARRPLAACRAVILAALWPDPADPNCPERFRSEVATRMRVFRDRRGGPRRDWESPIELRAALLDFIGDFANWELSTDKDYLETSRAIVQVAHESLGGAPRTHPLVIDPFAGGGAIPLEVLRVGADAFASDLNPVAVLLNRVLEEYIPKHGAELAEEVRQWGEWVKTRAVKELAKFYPKDADGGVPIAYIWARTIRCEGPGCGAEVPLVRSLSLAKKDSRSIGLKLIPDRKKKRVDFEVIEGVKAGERGLGTMRRGSVTCPICNYTTKVERVRAQLCERHGGAADARLLAVASTRAGILGRSYRLPSRSDLTAAANAGEELTRQRRAHRGKLSLVPEESTEDYVPFVNRGPIYGMRTWADYFTPRQALALTTFARLIREAPVGGEAGRAVAVRTLLAFALDKQADLGNSLNRWEPGAQCPRQLFGRQAIPMVWDFAEGVPIGESSGAWEVFVEGIARALENLGHDWNIGNVHQADAARIPLPDDSADALVTDPPYYYSVQYADLADFFYVWLRRALQGLHGDLLRDELTPKNSEIIVQSPAHEFAPDGKNRAFYEARMAKALEDARRVVRPDGIGVVVFAHKSTSGWEAQLQATINAGWTIAASWPIDTENASRLLAQNRATLASSVHIVCRPRENPDGSRRADAIGDWREVLAQLPSRIHEWMPRLAREGVVGADAIFACLGPALEIFSRHARVEKASGETVALKEYLEHVWAAVAKEALAMIFTGADATGFEEDARLTAMWLWTLSSGGSSNDNGVTEAEDDQPGEGNEAESVDKSKVGGFVLEYDAARKIAQGLGAHLEALSTLIEVKGSSARLLPVAERTRSLFQKGESGSPIGRGKSKKKTGQLSMGFVAVFVEAEESGGWGDTGSPQKGQTVLDRVHQSMILFGTGRGEALKRFLVDDGVGRDDPFWRLAQALSALYPASTDEKRWVDGVLARKKGLGL